MTHTYTTVSAVDRRGVRWERRWHDQYPYPDGPWKSDRGEEADDVNDFGPFVGLTMTKGPR